MSLKGIASTCVKKDSESASASLNASLVSFERRSNSCRVRQARILGSCANISKRKGALSPLEGFFFKNLSNQTSFCFSLFSGRDGVEAWTGAVILNVIGCCPIGGLVVLLQVLFLDWVSTG